MPKKKIIMYVSIYLGLVVVIAILAYVSIGLSIGQFPTLPLLNFGKLFQKAPPAPGKSVTSVTKMYSGDKYGYYIYGKFIAQPSYKGDVLVGMFLIDDDTTKQPVPVHIGLKTGRISFGRYKGTFGGGATWRIESTDAIRSLLVVNKPVQIRVSYQQGKKQDEFTMMVQKALEGMMQGNWKKPPKFTLIPQMIGILE